MATYTELFDLRNDSVLKNRVVIAALIAAGTVMNEADSIPNHINRLAWARNVFSNPYVEANRMFMAILAANSSVSVSTIQGATDAVIQAYVDIYVDLFAVDPVAAVSGV